MNSNSGAGRVRLTAVPALVNRLLVPAAGGISARYPGLNLELICEARSLSLTRREADMALRFARPKAGGGRVLARKLADLFHTNFKEEKLVHCSQPNKNGLYTGFSKYGLSS